MRTAIAVTAVAATLGFGAGWIAHGGPKTLTRTIIVPPTPVSKPASIAKAEPPFPDFPKPTLETPVPTPDALSTTRPGPLTGNIPQLPTPQGGNGPILPGVPTGLPVADLNADEALVRRLVTAAGGDIVSTADAKDASGKVGRTLVAESDPGNLERLRNSLRKALGDRAILSDGGSTGGSSPETRKAEDALAALRKRRDQARIDFLPQAPILRDLEEEYRKAESSLSDLRRASSRQRLDILLRPTLT